MDIYYIDGQYVPSDQAVIPVNDLSLLRGYGVFDFFRTYGGSPFFLSEHLKRLANSAREIGLDIPWTQEELTDIIKKTLKKNHHEESNVRIIVTGGPSKDFITPEGCPRLLVLVSPVPPLPDWWYTNGIKIITIPVERTIPGAKSINYLPATIALKEAKRKGAVEAVYMDALNYVKEGTTSNLFAFFGNTLKTPGKKILSGITRKVILEIAKPVFTIKICEVKKQELLTADEIFISGSNKGLVPVVQVDDTIIGTGKPGKNVSLLMKYLHEYTTGTH